MLSVLGGIYQISEMPQTLRQPQSLAKATSNESVAAFRRKHEEALDQCCDLVDMQYLPDETRFRYRQAIDAAKTRLALAECPKVVLNDLEIQLMIDTPNEFWIETDPEYAQIFLCPLDYFFDVINDSASNE